MFTRPRHAPDVVAEELEGELCLMRLQTGEVLILSPTAADVWLLSTGSLAVDQIVEQLSAAYATVPEMLTENVHDVLLDLTTRGFLVDTVHAADR